jgi:hydrogenase maturation protein HypF
VDGFLLHDRPIHMRVDDSVARVAAGQPYFLRRARGYAPDPLQLGTELLPILGAGAELKNTFCLTRQKYAFISHHIGDLENYDTLQSYEKAVLHFERLFRIRPEVIACDLHPDYLSTHYAQERAERDSLPLIQVQHHHAHMAACLGENGWPADQAAIGLCFDGTGYGTDGAIWGGEILLGNMQGFKRRFRFGYFPLPGGDAAVRKPARTTLALLWQLGIPWDPEYPAVKALCEQERTVISTQLQHNLNVPQTSSMGRLFDAVSALIGVRQTVTYEGQAAIELEAISDANEQGSYPFQITADVVDLAPALNALLADWSSGVHMSTIGGRFHNLIVDVCLDMCQMIRRETDVSTVRELTGGQQCKGFK